MKENEENEAQKECKNLNPYKGPGKHHPVCLLWREERKTETDEQKTQKDLADAHYRYLLLPRLPLNRTGLHLYSYVSMFIISITVKHGKT